MRAEVRPLAAHDVADVARLCDQELVLDRAAATLPEVLMRRPHAALVATSDSSVIGACFGSVAQPTGQGSAGFIDMIVVDRAEQRRGVGQNLVAEMERELAARGCQHVSITGNGPYYAWPGIDIHYTSAICLAELLGYRRGGCEVNMDVDLAQAPLDTVADEQRLRSLGIAVRSAGPQDEALLQDSLASTWQPGWIAEVVAAVRTDGAGLHMALSGQQCVGFCAFGVGRVHEVGPVGVSPDARQLGIGRVLLRRCLAQQLARGLSTAELVWAGPISYFARVLGATIGRAFWVYDKNLTQDGPAADWRDRIGLL